MLYSVLTDWSTVDCGFAVVKISLLISLLSKYWPIFQRSCRWGSYGKASFGDLRTWSRRRDKVSRGRRGCRSSCRLLRTEPHHLLYCVPVVFHPPTCAKRTQKGNLTIRPVVHALRGEKGKGRTAAEMRHLGPVHTEPLTIVLADIANGSFTLSDTESETNTDSNKMCTERNGNMTHGCLCLWAVWTPPHNSMQAIFIGLYLCLGLWQCKHTIRL